MPDQVRLDSLSFCLWNNSFLNPSDRFPSLEFDLDLIGTDGLHQVEEYMPIDSITGKIEWLVNLNETSCHLNEVDKIFNKDQINKGSEQIKIFQRDLLYLFLKFTFD